MSRGKVALLILIPVMGFLIAIIVYYLFSIQNILYNSGAGIFW